MSYRDEKNLDCSQFEELLTDYLDGTLDRATHKIAAAHALSCPLCHALLNEVKGALAVCREISVPKAPLTRLEAKILAATAPGAQLACEEFENHLTDYLDGFLPAVVFHRWERHAVSCERCTDLPGEVVRSIAVCYSYKTDELPVPEGLHTRILRSTIGTERAETVRASLGARINEWLHSFSFPISVPQLAPVAMLLMLAALTFSQPVAADNSIGGIYQKSFELAEQTYKQGAGIVLGEKEIEPKILRQQQEPIQGTFVNEEK